MNVSLQRGQLTAPRKPCFATVLECYIVIVVEVIDPHDLPACCEKPLGHVKANEACMAGDESCTGHECAPNSVAVWRIRISSAFWMLVYGSSRL